MCPRRSLITTGLQLISESCRVEYLHDHIRVNQQLLDGVLVPEEGNLRPHDDRPGLGLKNKTPAAFERRDHDHDHDRDLGQIHSGSAQPEPVGTKKDVAAPVVLREYAVLADGERGVVVGPHGDFVWMCYPRWHDPALFSALVGGEGSYSVTPTENHVWGGYYEPDSLIWRSRWSRPAPRSNVAAGVSPSELPWHRQRCSCGELSRAMALSPSSMLAAEHGELRVRRSDCYPSR